MCGITGWVDFSKELTEQSDTVRAMTDSLSRRGPDAAGLWVHRHGLLGHRRLSIVDLSGGVQPMVYITPGGDEVALIYTGEVYNYVELRERLRGVGHSFNTQSDTEVVLHAYLEWGERCSEYLKGMFAFAVFDSRIMQLLLVRDRLGVKPLFYAEINSGILFASEPKAIIVHPEFTSNLSVIGLVDLLSLSHNTTQTAFQGIHELSPGHHLVLKPKCAPKIERYWSLQRRDHEDNLKQTVERTRYLLQKALDEQLYADVPVCTLLSGGLDSTILSAMAQRKLQIDKSELVNSFSVDFVGQAENFQKDSFRPEHDQPFALLAAEYIGSQHQTILIDNNELVAGYARKAVYRSNDSPMTFGDVDTSLYLLFKAIKEYSTVAISGEAADEVFGGYAWFRDQLALDTPRFPWLSRMQLLQSKLINPQFNKLCNFAEYQRSSYNQALARVEHLHADSLDERKMREVCHMHIHRWLPILLGRKDRLSMYAGLEVRVPYTDHELVEYVYNVPWSIKSKDGVEKWLLKEACIDLVPLPVLNRKKSPYPTSANLAYEQFLRTQIKSLLNQPGNRVFQIIDHGNLRRELDQAAGYFSSQLRRNNLETALSLAGWLEESNLSL